MKHVAIDWSGAKTGAGSKIWLAEVEDGRLTRLESGRTREEIIAELIAMAERDPDFVVGLDFAFSAPEWFLTERGADSVDAFWALAAREGEDWLAKCDVPFWGRPGRKKPDLPEHFRDTEWDAPRVSGSSAKSFFQIGGAGAVGTGSIRGLPFLADLRAAGFSIWPFHEVAYPLVIEIYPRLLTGPVVKSSREGRLRYLRTALPSLPEAMLQTAASGEDAFDAAISAIVMARHAPALAELEESKDPRVRREGRIWYPAGELQAMSEAAPGAMAESEALADSGCPFCDVHADQVVASSTYAIAIRDRYPVSRGHTLVIPRKHAGALFDLPADVLADVWALVADVRGRLGQDLDPDGFTIGVNEGAAAGQTVPHPHIHIVPRFEGDVPDPRGGIRWVVPEHAKYW